MENENIEIISDIKQGFVGLTSKEKIHMHDKSTFRLLLNMILASQFGLTPNYSNEGGVRGHEIRLINDKEFIIGLRKDSELSRGVSKYEKNILKWYTELLQHLFVKGELGKIMPHLLWFDPKYKNGWAVRFELFQSAVTQSDWRVFTKPCDFEDRFDFYQKFLSEDIKKYFTGTLSAEEFLPFAERPQFFLAKQKFYV